jgi:2',3'-cyclic-nucleotide 2'-phosphodiesterase
MNIVMVGDIVGAAGRQAFARVIKRCKAAGEADFVVANAENAAGGNGLTGPLAEELFLAGANVLTLGDHAWDQRELQGYIAREPRILRPANFAPGCPGRGIITLGTDWGDVTVVSLIGRVFMKPYDCPFRTADQLLRSGSGLGKVVLVDMHAEATSEKTAMGRYLDGRATCVAGSHTHVQTSDEGLLPGGTAYITDLGMTGAKDSVLGRDVDSVIQSFVTGMPTRLELSTKDVRLEGVRLRVDRQTGKATAIERIREKMEGNGSV